MLPSTYTLLHCVASIALQRNQTSTDLDKLLSQQEPVSNDSSSSLHHAE